MSSLVKNRFIGSTAKKKLTFLGQELEIAKLNINQVLEIQALTREAEASGDNNSGIKVISAVVRAGAADLRELTQTELQELPMDDLSELSNAIMDFSNLIPKETKPAT